MYSKMAISACRLFAHDRRQIQPPFAGPDVADVAPHFWFGSVAPEIAIKHVRGDVERMIAVCGRLELVLFFGDPVFTHQAAHTPMANIDANFLELFSHAWPPIAAQAQT